jgi:hypothetical protein
MDVVVDRCAALGRAPEDGDGMCSSAGEAGKRVEKTRGFDASPRAALISWGHGGVLALGTARIRAVRRMGHSFERVLLNPSSGRRPGSGATTWYAAS